MKNNKNHQDALRNLDNASTKCDTYIPEPGKPELISKESSYQEGFMLWNNDETNWDCLSHNSDSISEGNIVNGLANFDQSAYNENAVLISR
jgi:hypothetical protein